MRRRTIALQANKKLSLMHKKSEAHFYAPSASPAKITPEGNVVVPSASTRINSRRLSRTQLARAAFEGKESSSMFNSAYLTEEDPEASDSEGEHGEEADTVSMQKPSSSKKNIEEPPPQEPPPQEPRPQKVKKLYDADDAILVSSHMLLSDLMRTPLWLILPTHDWKYKWDVMIIILALYSCLVSPLEIGFAFTFSSMNLVETCVTLAFLLDVLFNFCTAYEDSSGKLVTSFRDIRNRYLSRWFIIDLFASFPFSWFGGGGLNGSTAMKLLKLPRVFRISHLWKVLESGGSGAFYVQWGLRVLSLTFFLTIIVHWITCLWNVVVDADPAVPPRWYTGMVERGYWTNSTCPNFACSYTTRYSSSLYFSVLMILGNDVYATSSAERFFASSVSLLGAIVQAYVLGQVTMLISNLTAKSRKWREKMDNVAEVMRYMNIDGDIQKQVRLYFDYAFQVYGGISANNEWMWELSDSLHGDLLISQYRAMISKVPFFKNVDTLFVKAIVLQFTSAIYLPEDYIITYGAIGREMFFIAHGCTYASNEDESVVFSLMRDGDFFGEIALMMECPRTAHVKAATFANVEQLTKESFDKVIKDFPTQRKVIEAAAKLRMKKGASARSTNASSGSGGHKNVLRAIRGFKRNYSGRTSSGKPSLSAPESADIVNLIQKLTAETTEMRELVRQQSEKIDSLEASR